MTSQQELDQLVAGEHGEPHGILGPHPEGEPGARRVVPSSRWPSRWS